MIYLNKFASTAGTISLEDTYVNYQLEEVCDINLIRKLFSNYKVMYYMPNGGLHRLELKPTIIKIYLNR